MDAGESMLALVKVRRQALQLAPFVREEAEARVKAEGVPGMDEGRLNTEWVNDVLADPDARAYEAASADPAGAYRGFLDQRIREPYHVTFRAMRALAQRVGATRANTFVHLRWWQEIAWAKRMRAFDSARTAVLAHSFLLQAARDPGRAFTELAAAWEVASLDGAYMRSPSHEMTEHAIRYGNALPAHTPVFLGLFATKLGENLDRMGLANLSRAAVHARQHEEAELRAVHARKAANAARRSPLSRIMGVIDVAIETGRSSNALVVDEGRFLVELERGRTPCATAGLPYSEFMDWLRAAPPAEDPGPPPPGTAVYQELTTLLARPLTWLGALPHDYQQAGASEVAVYQAWVGPVARREVPTPRDLVVDYGFHLVQRTYRR